MSRSLSSDDPLFSMHTIGERKGEVRFLVPRTSPLGVSEPLYFAWQRWQMAPLSARKNFPLLLS